MKRQRVIDPKYLPMPGPLQFIAVWWLLLDRLDAPGWVWGSTGAFVGVVVLVWVLSLWFEERVHPSEIAIGRPQRYPE